jgi:hypothetical protein
MEEPVPDYISKHGMVGNGEDGGPIGSSLSLMGSQPMPGYLSEVGTARAAPTDADWNMYQQMAMFAPGTDMAQAKADFMSGGGKGVGGPEMGAYNPAGEVYLGGSKDFDFTGGMPMGSSPAQTMPQQGGIAGLSLQPPQGSQQPSNIAQSYMNPYLQSVLDPQMAELRRQNDITNMQANAKLTGAGAFGGGRQAIMNAENNRNLMMEQNKTVGQGYANAYDKAMQQFNTEQGQAKTLAEMMAEQGQQERNIEQQGISADYNEFLAQRDDLLAVAERPFVIVDQEHDVHVRQELGDFPHADWFLWIDIPFTDNIVFEACVLITYGYTNLYDLARRLIEF